VRELMDAEAAMRTLKRVATEVVEATGGAESLAIVGIRRGGVDVAAVLAEQVGAERGEPVPTGAIDIALYRDDAATALPDPKIGPSSIPFDVQGRDVLIVDDVLQTGRTIRAAIECLLDYGRPRRIWLAVLLDRGGRELPIAADFVGKRVDVPKSARIDVRLAGDADSKGAYVDEVSA
jgi:pyrimidine operon attenuation protein/uracil phosphoribosyltransferase